MTEVNGGKANVLYSTAEYTVTVSISLNENDKLVATLVCSSVRKRRRNYRNRTLPQKEKNVTLSQKKSFLSGYNKDTPKERMYINVSIKDKYKQF